MSIISKIDLIANVRQSKVIDSKRFDEWLKNNDVESAKEIARRMVSDHLLTPWQAKYLISGRSQLTLGSYRLLNRIRQDEMGDRFLAINTSLNRKVDLQILTRNLTQDNVRCDAFIKKAQQVAKLDHPNLVHVYDIDQESGRCYLVIEHVEGTTLEEACERHFSVVEIARIIKQAVVGLTYAHQHNVIHGCLTREDLILTKNGEIKIQRIPLSPLRQEFSPSSNTATPGGDLKAISKIGFQLLQNVTDKEFSKERDEIKSILFTLRSQADESGGSAVASLEKWLESKSPTNSDSSTRLPGLVADPLDRSNRKTPASSRSSSKSLAAKASPSGGEGLWHRNPIAVIATAALVAVVIMGGSVMGILQLIKQTDSTVAQQSTHETPARQKKTNPTVDVALTSDTATTKNNSGPPPVKRQTTKKVVAPGIVAPPKDPQPELEKTASQPVPSSESPEQTTDSPPVAGAPAAEPPDSAPPMPVLNSQDLETNPNVSDTAMAAVPMAAVPLPNANATQDPVVNTPPDILSEISGIGEVTQKNLYQNGVTTFKQLTEMSAPQIKTLLEKAGMQRIELVKCQSWIVQAKTRLNVGSGAPVTAAVQPSLNADPLAASFVGFPRIMELPPAENNSEIKIADLKIRPQFLLGTEIVSEPGVSKIKLMFVLNRSPDDKQKWLVGVKRRAKEKPTEIAIFRKSKDAFYFQWLPEAEKNKHAQFLKNCYIKLSLPDGQSAFLTLRQPVMLPALRLTEKELTNLIESEIPSLPNLNTVVVEVLPMRIPGVTTAVPKSGIEKGSPGQIWLKQTDQTGFLWIEVAGDIRTRLKLQASLMILYQGRPQRVRNLKMLSDVAARIQSDEAIAFNLYQRADNQFQNAPYGKKTEYGKIKDDALKNSNAAKAMSAKIIQYSEILPKVLNQPISVRVYAKMGEYQTVLAITETPPLPTPAKQPPAQK